MTKTINIRPATPDDYDSLAEAFYKMWTDNGMSDSDFKQDWKQTTLDFMSEATVSSKGRAFVAEDGDQLVGAAQCLISRKLYPPALKPDVRTDGYIWGVYVEPSQRRKGLATQLTEQCTAYLKLIGCTRLILHASPGGKPVYEALGFSPTNEMRIEVT